ncbi:MAG: OmpA family protein [Desulfobacteraceae bacterium]|nr:OmpA family protein [Desulfobacteraceae bacterium]
MKKSLLLALAVVLAGGTIASAANLAGQFSVSPVIGGYTYDNNQPRKSDANMIYGARAGYNFTNNFGFEALFDYVDSSFAGQDINMYRYGGELLYHFFPDNAFVPYLAAGYSGLHFDAKGIDNRVRGVFDYGVGAKYFLTDNFALRADVRHLVYRMDNQSNNNLEYTLGAYIPFGGAKPAVKPVEPPPAPAPVPVPKAVEPPPAPPAAPTAELTVTPVMVKKGENAILNWKSLNATGCDIQPGIGYVPPQGVRTITPDDTTIYNMICSGNGGTAASSASVTVMMPPPPAPAPAPVTPKAAEAAKRFCSKPAILDIQFDTNKSDIKPKYEADLKNVGEFLQEFPKARGEISGHTDSTASNAYNMKLSQRRAESVAKYITTTFGIDPARITTKGYGETKPIASNKTKAGRAKNRRIEANFTCE